MFCISNLESVPNGFTYSFPRLFRVFQNWPKQSDVSCRAQIVNSTLTVEKYFTSPWWLHRKGSPEIFVKLFRKTVCSYYLTSHCQMTWYPTSESSIEFLLYLLTFAETHQRQFIPAFSAVIRRKPSHIEYHSPTSLELHGVSGCIDFSLWLPNHLLSQCWIYFL